MSSQTLRRTSLADWTHAIRIPGHWIWAVPIILAVAVLALRQIDWYPATYDEYFSMTNSGWVINQPYSPIDVLKSLAQHSPNHTPLYFLLLNLWGNLVGYELALGRVLTIFAALLALATTYRLSRDFVAPAGGLIALVVVSSSAFYNCFYAHVRMYPLLVLTSALCLWLYLRIMYGRSDAKRQTYLAFFLATLALVYTHAFSALFLLALGAYHVLIAPKDIRWFWTSLAVAAALALFSPWLIILITRGIELTFDHWPRKGDSVWEVLASWLYVGFNGSLELAALAAIAALVGLRKKTIKVYHLFILFFILVLALIAQASGALQASSMRLTLSSLPPLTMSVAAGIYTLYRLKRWLGLLTLFWILAGLSAQHSADLQESLGGRIRVFNLPAWHAVSRLALESEQKMTIVGYRFPGVDIHDQVFRGRSQKNNYFDTYDIEFIHADGRPQFDVHMRRVSIFTPIIWTFYRTGSVASSEATKIKSIMRALQYELCAADEVGFDTIILQYRWSLLECGAPDALSQHQNELLEYDLYALQTDSGESAARVVVQWRPRTEFAIEDYRLSHQIINEDWERVAQLDVPLVHEGELIRLSIDLQDVPPGAYRLVVILYDARTGERQAWLNNAGYIPEMLKVGEITLG